MKIKNEKFFKPKNNEKRDNPKKNAKRWLTVNLKNISTYQFVLLEKKIYNHIGPKKLYITTKELQGFRLNNRIYFLNGDYTYVNKKSYKISYTYDRIPVWVNDFLLSLYKKVAEKKEVRI